MKIILPTLKSSGMSLIKIVAPLEPVPFPRPSSNGKRRFNPKRYSEFKSALGFFAKQAMHGQAPFTGAVKLTTEVYKKIIPTALKFGDWDNHAKAICDALNGICYHDDKQITEAHIFLFKGDPLIKIVLEEVA